MGQEQRWGVFGVRAEVGGFQRSVDRDLQLCVDIRGLGGCKEVLRVQREAELLAVQREA